MGLAMTSDSQGLNTRILIATVSSAADSALYRAKRAGRNCVMVYDPAESAEVKAIVEPPPSQA